MSFFYDLNKKLDGIRATPEVTHQQLNERDEGKPGKNFAKIAKDAGERYGSKEAGERVAGAVRNKLKAQGKLEEEGMSRAAKGYEKYGKQGMEALAKAGREGKALDPVRQKYDKYDDEQVNEKVEVYRQDAPTPGQMGTSTPYRTTDKEFRDKLAGEVRTARNQGTFKPTGGDTYNRMTTGGSNGSKIQAMGMKNSGQKPGMAEGGSYLNYADSAAENPAPPKKPMAAPAPKPQGVMDKVKSIGNKVASGVNKLVGHGSDEEMIKDLQRKSGAPVTGKKPTFADKIANAKKEVDEMLGDVAAEAIKTALSPKQKKIDLNKNGKLDANDFAMLRKGAKPEMDEDNAFDYKSPKKDAPKVGSVERGAKHDIKHTATGRMVTRRTDAQGISVGSETDDEGNKKEKQLRSGAPNKSDKPRQERVTAKSRKQDRTAHGQQGFKKAKEIEEGDNDSSELKAAMALLKKSGYKVTKAESEVDEEAVSGNQAVAARIARGVQKGTAKAKPGSASAEMAKMKPKELDKFAKTNTKGLPKKVSKKKEEEVEESSTRQRRHDNAYRRL